MLTTDLESTWNCTSLKPQVIHRAGIKMPSGYGWVINPKKYAYNEMYNRTSFDVFKLLKKLFKEGDESWLESLKTCAIESWDIALKILKTDAKN